jgi:hypothetical protein
MVLDTPTQATLWLAHASKLVWIALFDYYGLITYDKKACAAIAQALCFA